MDEAGDENTDNLADAGQGSFNAERARREATEEPRVYLVADIVGHPKGSPSIEELEYMNPSLPRDAIHQHLDRLREVGVISEVDVDAEVQLPDSPDKFYRLTDEAREVFAQSTLFPEEAWQRQYERVEKTPRIRALEQLSRTSV